MRITPFEAHLPKVEQISDPDQFFPGIKESFAQYLEQGLYSRLTQPGVFVYKITKAARTYLGLLGCADIQEYLSGNIKKHEKTLISKQELHLQLFQQHQAMIKPVLLAYPAVAGISHWMQEVTTTVDPSFKIDFALEDQKHQLWQVVDLQNLAYIQELFATFVPNCYIADGHHRCATAASIYEEKKLHGAADGQFFCALFPSSDLEILDFNRVIQSLDGQHSAIFLDRLRGLFTITALETPQKPSQKFTLTMLLNNQWYHLAWKPEVLDRYAWEKVILDTQLLNELVLRDLLGILDVRKDFRVINIEGPLGLEGVAKKINDPANGVGFCLFPVALQDMMTLSDHEQMLPPKSTWFEPRMKTGLVVCQL
jgi:uncharacterized protein (DUF1015 family)